MYVLMMNIIFMVGVLTDRFASDEGTVDDLIAQMTVDADHISLDGAYDSKNVYVSLKNKFPNAKIVIPPDKNSVIPIEINITIN